ncbi:MAG: sulfurtransferase-like selenium metabolism protein YedF [Clostridiales bacterium]|jgi:selenium metabolism protein YedF|nr:sulfurtransferase-like selenium metabolism protein YedF [Clostridiales bacterium]
MKIVDCIGDVCPMPVIKAKRALAENGGGPLEIRVDNGISLENVKKYLGSLGHDAVSVTRDGYFAIITNPEALHEEASDSETGGIVVIASDVMGQGDDDLGRKLMGGFIFALTQLDVLPQTVVFYNRGVMLTVEGSHVLEDLRALAAAGVRILSCGLCVSHFDC